MQCVINRDFQGGSQGAESIFLRISSTIKTKPCRVVRLSKLATFFFFQITRVMSGQGMENQESSANTEVPFDVTEITADDINMEDISTQSNDMTEKASGMNKSQITALALNLLSTDSMIHSTGIHIPEMKPCIICKQKFISHPDEPIKEFTMATCGCLYHQKCLEGFLLNVAKTRAKLSCPNWDCKGREIETLITQDLFKEMDKPTTLTAEDTASKQVYSENATPVSEDTNEIYMNQLGLFSGEEQSSSKTIEVAKETSDHAN